MKKDIFDIIKNKKKLKEIKRIVKKYGLKLTSNVLMSICILLTSASASRKSDTNTQRTDDVGTNIVIMNPLVTRGIEPLTFEDIKVNDEEITSLIGDITKASYEKSMFVSSPLNNKITNDYSLTNVEKMQIIFDKFNLSPYQLEVCAAIACAEANGEGTNYEEAVNVICTAYNRTISSAWVYSFGDNLYDQMTAPNQFVVYQSGTYLDYMGRYDLPGYQAVIDFLSNSCELEGHNYLSFRSNNSGIQGEELVSGGNLYFNELEDEDRLGNIRVEEEVTRVLT